MEELKSRLESDVITKGKDPVTKDDCIFCKIARGEAPSTTLFKNSEVTVFYDVRPAAKEHLLIIPNSHYGNPKTLSKDDIPMVEYLHAVGQAVLEQRGGCLDNTRVGFHWPPFNTVDHLHLHMVYPVSDMGILGKMVYTKSSPWFVTYDWVLQRLCNLPDGKAQKQVTGSATQDQNSKSNTGDESRI